MQEFRAVSAFLDPYLIWAFRIPSEPWLGFALGLVYISLVATIIGELCMAGAYFFNKDSFAETNREMVRHNNMSLRMLLRKDKQGYKLVNKEANEQFGKNFFSRIALFAASLFPAFFIMGWLDMRFGRVDFAVPLFGEVGPGFFFVPTYIAVRILFAKSKPYLPLFRTLENKVKKNETTEEELLSITTLSDEAKKKRTPTALDGDDYIMPGDR